MLPGAAAYISPISIPYLPYISPTSPPHLPHISPASPRRRRLTASAVAKWRASSLPLVAAAAAAARQAEGRMRRLWLRWLLWSVCRLRQVGRALAAAKP